MLLVGGMFFLIHAFLMWLQLGSCRVPKGFRLPMTTPLNFGVAFRRTTPPSSFRGALASLPHGEGVGGCSGFILFLQWIVHMVWRHQRPGRGFEHTLLQSSRIRNLLGVLGFAFASLTEMGLPSLHIQWVRGAGMVVMLMPFTSAGKFMFGGVRSQVL